MLTHLVLLLIAIYWVIAAFCWVQLLVDDEPPAALDHATTYGPDNLAIWERLLLWVYVPAIIWYVWRNDKWPGLKDTLPELWCAIVVGRQYNVKDATK